MSGEEASRRCRMMRGGGGGGVDLVGRCCTRIWIVVAFLLLISKGDRASGISGQWGLFGHAHDIQAGGDVHFRGMRSARFPGLEGGAREAATLQGSSLLLRRASHDVSPRRAERGRHSGREADLGHAREGSGWPMAAGWRGTAEEEEGKFQDGGQPLVRHSTMGMAAPGQGVVHGGIRMRLKGGADDAKTTGKRQRDPKAKHQASGSGSDNMKDGDEQKCKGIDDPDAMADMTSGTGMEASARRAGSNEWSDGDSRIAEEDCIPGILDDVKDLTNRMIEAKRERDQSHNASLPEKEALIAQKRELESQGAKCIDRLKHNLLDLLNWREKKDSAGNCPHIVPGESVLDTCFECTKITGPPDYSRGGFACVILDKKRGIAYRLEPMKHQIDAAAWLGFHSVLELFGVRAAQSVENDKPKAVLFPDRGMLSPWPHEVWNETKIVRLYQEPTLAAFSKHVLRHRNKFIKKGQNEKGACIAVNDENNRLQSRILTPRAYFWHSIDCPIFAEDEKRGIVETDFTRRLRGKELADVLCVKDGGGDKSADTPRRDVKLLCTVFDIASGGDLATVSRTSWRGGAPSDIPEKVVRDIGQALRCMHACGIAHGDVKMANVLIMDGTFWLADLPALTRATTKMLTNDPVCSTFIRTGKRMLANDMWGLGLITLTLIGGFAPFKKACEKLKALAPPAASGPHWIVFTFGFIDTLRRQLPNEECLDKCRKSLEGYIMSVTGKKALRLLDKDQRTICRREGDQMALNVAKNAVAGAKVWEQLAYCFDICNVARNSLAMPLPGEAFPPPYGLVEGQPNEKAQSSTQNAKAGAAKA